MKLKVFRVVVSLIFCRFPKRVLPDRTRMHRPLIVFRVAASIMLVQQSLAQSSLRLSLFTYHHAIRLTAVCLWIIYASITGTTDPLSFLHVDNRPPSPSSLLPLAMAVDIYQE